MLQNKKILLAVCGSVSFYKAYEILSSLKKLGADVYVMLSDGALNFTQVQSFQALCDHPVLSSQTEDWHNGIGHMGYSRMDLVIIAPASVNTINKLAAGICDNVFMETLIASSNVPLIIAPAANNRMLEHFSTVNSLSLLEKNGAIIIEPVRKTLACKDVGKGGLADVNSIVYAAQRAILTDRFYQDKTVVITGGPTEEKIDDVRTITNLSSGKMAKALADAFYFLGADVIFITSVDFEVPYKVIKFDSSFGLQSALYNQKLKKDDIIVMAAAVSDYIPNKIKGKLDKNEIGDILNLKFKKAPDIISGVTDNKIKKIGFKLEVSDEEALYNARNMLKEKNLNAVCLNVLGNTVKFGGDNTKITFMTEKTKIELKENSKREVALEIANLIKVYV
ncbi:bifunctional phosphopantothenoylcysteine decarboxylase/phosphopantothenate--cysteine ligase CoaBC [Campylobacter geochelonis]|uniref:bifunctional phosphopantothenoylcysteine decarboxylase/phosphopantothenate--cysteine ligase CoaBC n=1 Tax=Campylobacter geochelonis TaxID=1780362 RepID=UPI0007709801|nr:bifunctional phosphopantothenoylcysteine decarboxylase/phosphopantothenate--cysteine ligase CoaBC [Campylobacter geochelonis]CZE50007.1 bifunctional phosphopantothenoylcysteine decarboxylase/phosphopantothenate synthase [Campylobacter geochelonis]